MANAVNSAFGPAPLQTAITQQGDEVGVPFPERGQPRNQLNTQWMAWFNALYAQSILQPRMVSVAQADLASLAAFLGTFDAVIPPQFNPANGTVTLGTAPILAYVTDYNHTLQWTGAGWQWGPGDGGSGMFAPFAVAPTGNGWHACNGASVNYLKADGTLGSVTLPNTASTPAYIKCTSAYSATITGAGSSSFTGTPATLTGTVSSIAQTGTAGVDVTPAGVTLVAVEAHTHPAPTLTMNSYTPAGTVSSSGDAVASFSAVLYFRQ